MLWVVTGGQSWLFIDVTQVTPCVVLAGSTVGNRGGRHHARARRPLIGQGCRYPPAGSGANVIGMAAADAECRPLPVQVATTPTYRFREHGLRFLISGQQSGGSYSLMEIVSPRGSGPGLHVHDGAEEHFVVLNGEVEFEVGGERCTAGPGDVVHAPRGVAHAFTVRSDQATTLATFTPAGEEEAFMALAVLVTE